jgi:hypothetical protein
MVHENRLLSTARGLSHLAVTLSTYLLLGGCTPDRSAATGGTESDATGAGLVENEAAAWAAGEEWVIAPEPIFEVGAGATAEQQFHDVVGAARLSDGRIAVGDRGSSQVRLFASSGELLATAGRQGAGPEEFGRMAALVPLGGDSLVVFDAGNARVSLLGPDGRFARSFLLPAAPGADLVGVLESGSMVFGLPRAGALHEGISQDTVVYVVLSAVGEVLDTLESGPGWQRMQHIDGQRISRITVPFASRSVARARGNRIVIGFTAHYEFREYGTGLKPTRTIRRDIPARRFTDAYFQRYLEASPMFRSAIEVMPRPRDLPAFSSIIVDRDDHLWVEDYPRIDAAEASWAVFDPEGRLLGTVALPTRFRPTDIGGSYVLGVWSDELGVEHVRMYQLRRSRS